MYFPLISIIVPVYNAEKYLHRCISSIISQTYDNWELILVNDGSTDSSRIICEEYQSKDKRIRVFSKENQGVSSARNYGLKYAQGEWINFVDADDWIADDCIQSCVKYLGYDIDLLMFSIQWASDCRLPHKLCVTLEDFKEIVPAYIAKITFVTPVAKLYKNTIIKENLIYFDEKLNSGEDTLFFLAYFKHVKGMQLLPYEYYHYDVSAGNSLSKLYAESWEYEHYLITKTFSELDTIEVLFDLNLLKFRFLFSEWRIHKYLEGKSHLKFCSLNSVIKEVANDNVLRNLSFSINQMPVIDKKDFLNFSVNPKRYFLRYLIYNIMIRNQCCLVATLYVKLFKSNHQSK